MQVLKLSDNYSEILSTPSKNWQIKYKLFGKRNFSYFRIRLAQSL